MCTPMDVRNARNVLVFCRVNNSNSVSGILIEKAFTLHVIFYKKISWLYENIVPLRLWTNNNYFRMSMDRHVRKFPFK